MKKLKVIFSLIAPALAVVTILFSLVGYSVLLEFNLKGPLSNVFIGSFTIQFVLLAIVVFSHGRVFTDLKEEKKMWMFFALSLFPVIFSVILLTALGWRYLKNLYMEIRKVIVNNN